MAVDLTPQTVNLQKRFISRVSRPRRLTETKAAQALKKRTSRDNMVVHPDPFRYGNPNPLGCHPWYSSKHPDYIHRPMSIPGAQFLHITSVNNGSLDLTSYPHEGKLMIKQSDDHVLKPVQADSLISLEYPLHEISFSGPSSSRNEVEPAIATTDEKFSAFLSSIHKTCTTATHDSAASSSELLKSHEVHSVKRNNERAEGSLIKAASVAMLSSVQYFSTADPTSQLSSYARPAIARPKVLVNSGLPSGWGPAHDRFIAYLDTHAPLTLAGGIPTREWEVERYCPDQMAIMLHKKFPKFHGLSIPKWAIETRLLVLDLRDNNFFNMEYGCYRFEEWGENI